MSNPVSDLLAEFVVAAEKQLIAARKLDIRALNASTALRQDLLFQLGLLDPTPEDLSDPVAKGHARTLSALDFRLQGVIAAGLGAISGAIPPGRTPTYSANGRLRGGAW